MYEDIYDRVKELRRARKESGLRGVWLAKETTVLAKEISDYLCENEKEIGLRPSTTEVIHLALQEFKLNYLPSDEDSKELREMLKRNLDNLISRMGLKEDK